MLPLKRRLEALGLILFVDVEGRLDGNRTFPEALDQGVRAASAVLGCWSPWALTRPWVQTECAMAKDENKLVAVERVALSQRDVPALFYLVDRKPLIDFVEDKAHEGWAMTLTALATKLRLWADNRSDAPEAADARAKAEILDKAAAVERRALGRSVPASLASVASTPAGELSTPAARAWAAIENSLEIGHYRRFERTFETDPAAFLLVIEAEARARALERWDLINKEDPRAISEAIKIGMFPELERNAQKTLLEFATAPKTPGQVYWAPHLRSPPSSQGEGAPSQSTLDADDDTLVLRADEMVSSPAVGAVAVGLAMQGQREEKAIAIGTAEADDDRLPLNHADTPVRRAIETFQSRWAALEEQGQSTAASAMTEDDCSPLRASRPLANALSSALLHFNSNLRPPLGINSVTSSVATDSRGLDLADDVSGLVDSPCDITEPPILAEHFWIQQADEESVEEAQHDSHLRDWSDPLIPRDEMVGQPVSLRQAVAEGDPVARYEFALQTLAAGDGAEALSLLRASANQGLAMAQYRLAKMYERGEGVPVDLALARQWTGRAAAAGNSHAMHDLGVFFARGEGAPVDEAAAFRCFLQAAELGVEDSQFNLGLLYQQGRGTSANEAVALFWFLVAGANGDVDARARAASLEAKLLPSEVAQARARAEAFRPRAASARANGDFGPRSCLD